MGFGINRVVVSGRLCKDPELRATRSGLDVMTVRLATEDRKRGADGAWVDDASFLDVVAFGGVAAAASRELRKGSRAVFGGRVRQRTWEDEAGPGTTASRSSRTTSSCAGSGRRRLAPLPHPPSRPWPRRQWRRHPSRRHPSRRRTSTTRTSRFDAAGEAAAEALRVLEVPPLLGRGDGVHEAALVEGARREAVRVPVLRGAGEAGEGA